MGGGSDDGSDDERRSADERAGDRGVSDDADWALVVQKPVERATPDGLTVAVIAAVAEAEGVRPSDVTSPPLYEVVDTSALDAAFFGSRDEGDVPGGNVSTEFTYRGYRIVVRSDGWVLVFERRED